jgi:hypothetical protein
LLVGGCGFGEKKCLERGCGLEEIKPIYIHTHSNHIDCC